MSYILDALRRAEAERERGAVPSLASQQHSIEIEDEAPPRSRGLVWAVIGLAFALIATLAWTLLGSRGTPARPIADVAAVPAAPVTPVAVPQSLAEIAAVPSPSMSPSMSPSNSPSMSPSMSPSRSPSPTQMQTQSPATTPSPRPAPTPVAKTSPTAALAAPTAGPKRTAAVAAAAASEPRIYTQAELPDDIRRDLPRIAINGSSYSGDATSRMVMINGQVFHEGDQLSAGLVLDTIRRRSAVLAFRGFRYEVMF